MARDGVSEKVPVLLHGAAGDARMFLPLLRVLEAGRMVLAPDLPGHGRSGRWGTTDFGDYAAAVEAVCDAMGAGTIIPVGHSMGGLLALELFRRNPDRISAMVFISTGAALPVPREVLEHLAGDFDAFCARFVRLTYGDDAQAGLLQLAAKELSRRGRAIVENDFNLCASADYRPLLASIDRPTLVLAGRSDRMVPASIVDELAGGIRGARLRWYETGSHVPHFEMAAAVAEDISKFLDGFPG